MDTQETKTTECAPLWQPEIAWAQTTEMHRLMTRRGFSSYDALWQWSVEAPDEFWQTVIDIAQPAGDFGSPALQPAERMLDVRWFPNAALNYAETQLSRTGDADALVFWGEDKVKRRLSCDALRDEVSRVAQCLRARGVGKGDRVAGYLPNMPEAVIAMLATASLGAIWSSASPDFGVQGVLDRFGQIAPKVLFCVDGYWYAGKPVDCMAKNAEVAARLDTLAAVIVVPYLNDAPDLTNISQAAAWNDALAPYAPQPPVFERVAFNHPLYIVYSSGTTGVPKCIVHGHGGVLLQHLKEHRFHGDLRPGDRLFYFSTCGWMMWNWLVSGLGCGATLLLYDGSPFAAGGNILFDYAQAEGMTHFGTSAKFIDAAAKMGLDPARTHDLRTLRAIFSTGSPLAPEGFDWTLAHFSARAQLASISGGTDILSCFVLGNPILPVHRGEIQCRGLGMAVDVFDDAGRPLRGEKGELVCTRAFPSMPVGFWNDPDGSRYRAAYFERFDNVWCHGDYCEITPRGGLVIFGRSDATLNPGGVRIGTAEIYRQVEKHPDVVESLVVGQDWPPGKLDDVRVVLFVKLRPGLVLNDEIAASIKTLIRTHTTPRHVPAKVLQVSDIPRTKSGKIVELAVRNIIHGRPVKNVEALANPEALAEYAGRPELRD